MAQRSFLTQKVSVRARYKTTDDIREGGGDRHLLGGLVSSFSYLSYLQFVYDWTDVAKIESAYLVVTTKDVSSHAGGVKANSGAKVTRLSENFNDPNDSAAEGVFDEDPGHYNVISKDATYAANGTISSVADTVNRINVTKLIEAEAPKTVRKRDGSKALGKAHHGWALERRTTAAQSNPRFILASDKHADEPSRPYIELNYVPKPAPGTLDPIGPATTISQVEGELFEAEFNPANPATERMARIEIELYDGAEETTIWTYAADASPTDIFTNQFHVPLTRIETTGSRVQLLSQHAYEWRARVRSNLGHWTPWTPRLTLMVLSDAPTLSQFRPVDGSTFETLNGVRFGGVFQTGLTTLQVLSFRIQLRTQTTDDDPDWDTGLLWDTAEVAPTSQERRGGGILMRAYGGKGLEPGDYSWRMRMTNSRGAESDWYYADFTLTKGWEPDPGTVQLLTGYSRRKSKVRILIKGMDHRAQTIHVTNDTGGSYSLTFLGETTANIAHNASPATIQSRLEALSGINPGDIEVETIPVPGVGATEFKQVTFTREGQYGQINAPRILGNNVNLTPVGADIRMQSSRSPGVPVAVIEDASNIGVSEFFNDGGEFFFTLPAVHPQVSVIEPRQVHWSLEMYRGEGWKEVQSGLLVDFDGSDDDIIFYGVDYLGVLGKVMDERFNPKTAPDRAAVLYPAAGGGSKYVNKTIREVILDQLNRAIHDSDSPLKFFEVGSVATMDEKVTIFSTFKERMPFIAGLIESHRAGTGKRTRLRVRKTIDGTYQFVIEDDPGSDRNNLRMEYGGLVQGFRVIPFGDWGTRVNAMGRAYNALKVEYITEIAPAPAGETAQFLEDRYGRLPKANLWQDITDKNDLKRRAKQFARAMAKLGKHLALGIRVNSLAVKDGWDICDSIPVDIDRGAVDTQRFGSGYWTAWGWQWELKPNGFENLTLSMLPRDDTEAADEDLIDTDPFTDTAQWVVLPRDPVDDDDAVVFINSETGTIWRRDPETGEWVNETETQPGSPGIITNGSLTIGRFPDDVRPVVIVDELPDLPDDDFPEGAPISLTTDGRIYVNHGGVWTTPTALSAIWLPLTSVVAGEPVLVWDADDNLIPTGGG